MRIVLSLATGLLLLQQIQPAQDPVDSLARLSVAASKVHDIPMERSEDRQRLDDYADRIKKDVHTLAGSVKGFTDSFRKSLDLDADALDRVTRERPTPDRALFVCGAVAGDLGVKVSYVVAQKGKGQRCARGGLDQAQ